jgi:hypothetical protein
MKGKNLFAEVVGRGQVLTEALANEMIKRGSVIDRKTPCVFLSHKGEDKPAVRDIGEYLKNAGINIYLDVDDPGLQQAVARGDDVAITKFIDLGITNSTHLLAIVSEKTKTSWWVSYEVGFGKRNGNGLATLKLKDVTDLPSFLKITTVVDGINGLNGYLAGLARQIQEQTERFVYAAKTALEGNVVLSSRVLDHPLSKYIKTTV